MAAPHPSVEQRAARGKAARKKAPRCTPAAAFAESYADQNERDHAALEEACAPAVSQPNAASEA